MNFVLSVLFNFKVKNLAQMSAIQLRCRKCRTRLNEDCIDSVVSSHNESLNTNNLKTIEGICSQHLLDVFFIKETNMPKWINDFVNEANWCKGKLSCPQCSARLGSFDFVSGMKCACNKFILPPIHLVRSKIDYNIL